MYKKLLILSLFICISLYANTKYANTNKILVISHDGAKSSQEAKLEFIKKEASKQNLHFEYKFANEIKDKQNSLKEYDLIFFDALTNPKYIKKILESFSDTINKLDNKILPLMKGDNPFMKNISKDQGDIIYDYWKNGGVKNVENFIKYLKYKVFTNKNITIEKPKILASNGIYHPKYSGVVFKSVKEYFDFLGVDINSNKKPVIAVYFGRNSVVGNILEPIDDAIEYIESKGAIALPFFYKNKSKKDAIGLEFLQYEGKNVANVLLYLYSYVMDNGDKKRDFLKLNIPILHGMYYRGGDEKVWKKDRVGVPFNSIAGSYVMPESLGFTDSMIVGAQDKITKEVKTIPYQMRSLVNKAFNLSKLQSLKNKDKKVALMYYALGREKVGASFLNVFKSIESIFEEFKAKGYTSKEINEEYIKKEIYNTTKVLYDVNFYDNAHKMLKEGHADLYPYEEYMKEFYKLPVQVRTDMIREWGYPLKSNMLYYKDDKWYFLIPRIQIDNIVLMPQPLVHGREDSIYAMNKDLEKEDDRDWHNPSAPIPHSYFATYLYLQKQFKADALIHLGTHGTVEWTYGKERGLSVYDSPIMSLGEIPHFYPYIMNNTAETVQVRRRSRGVILSHLTPPFALAGAYNEVTELMELVAQYETVTEGLMKEQVMYEIIEKAMAINLHKDIQSQEKFDTEHIYDTKEELAKDFEHFVHEVEHHLQGITGVAQPLGSHTYGKAYKKEHLITTVTQMLGNEFLEKANGEKFGSIDYREFNNTKAYKLINEYCVQNKKLDDRDKEFEEFIKEGKNYYNLLSSLKENVNLFRALDGEHIEGGTGGGPIRNPQSLPTGTNLVSFDPTKVPTPAAYKTGKLLMDDFIANYYKKHKKYPNKITFNLWGLETVRHHGVLESQLLAAIGVEPIRDHRGKIKDTKIIPYSKLKRPRIDVVVSATGLYRDMYPNTIKLIAKAVEKISKLKEKDNYLRQNSLSIFESLKNKKGIDEKEAQYLSSIRIFSSKTGNYGSGTDAIQETSRWEDDKRMTKNYLEHTGYYFGADEKRWNEKNMDLDLYAKNLSGTNAVVFSRTSNLYGLLSSDDPYSHFGTIGMAIRNIDGKTPDTFISNLRDPNNAKIQSTQGFMNEELRGRYFHPQWIKKMQEENYAGTVEISDALDNFWGWQVVNPDVVRSDHWDDFKAVYVDDKYNLKIDEWFKKHNAQALANMTEKMLEAYRKNYWQTSEKNIKELLELKEDLEKNYNTNSYNTKLKEFERKAKLGFGLNSLKEGQTPKLSAPTVKGQKLEKQENKQEMDEDYFSYYIFAGLFFLMLMGMFYESRNRTF